MIMPKKITDWFRQKGWKFYSHQVEMFNAFKDKQSSLLIAPTGGGKTLASFLPSLIEIDKLAPKGLHTLYISPLKALTQDIERNLLLPINEINLNVKVETRTGDTSSYRRQRQKTKPPHILLITPESLMLMLTYTNAREIFSNVRLIIVDELHSFIHTKRGDLTALCVNRIKHLSTQSAFVFGLSATVAKPNWLANWIGDSQHPARIIHSPFHKKPQIKILSNANNIPYTGIMANYAVKAIYAEIIAANMCIIFVNTRLQAEFIFRELWKINESNLPIAIYHSSLSKEQRRKTELLTVSNSLKAIIATSALELGINWKNIDLVIQIGAPKGVSRLLQRIGRSNHQLNKFSNAILVPANCFELLECQAAINAIANNHYDGEQERPGSLDVVIQFIMNCACSEAIIPDKLYEEISTAYPYHQLNNPMFAKLFSFVKDGGYVLQHYTQYQRLKVTDDGASYIAKSAQIIRRHRQNIGTIVEAARLQVKLLFKKRSKYLGEIEEGFVQQLEPHDTFLFAGEIVSYVTVRGMTVEVRRAKAKNPKLPAYAGGTMPLTTFLANAVHELLNDDGQKKSLPKKIQDWLSLQEKFSTLPPQDKILVEHFEYKKTFITAIYTFMGRKANHTLGMFITRYMEHANLKPLSFKVNDYGLAITSLVELTQEQTCNLLTHELLNEELYAWLVQSPSMKRAFRLIAMITGLTQRRIAGEHKSLRQVTFSTDLIYDVLVKHEPEHILLKITQSDVEHDLLDIDRVKDLLSQYEDRIEFRRLKKPSPLAVPILLSLSKEKIIGNAIEDLLLQASVEDEANILLDKVRHSVN